MTKNLLPAIGLLLLFSLVPTEIAAAADESVAIFVEWNEKGEPQFSRRPVSPATPCIECGEPVDALAPVAKPPKISAEMEAILASAKGTDRMRVIVSFPESMVFPRLPSLDRRKPDTDPANRGVLRQRGQMAEGIASARNAANRGRIADLEREGAVVLDRFWITNSLHLDVPAAALRRIATRADIEHIEPVETAIPPPTIFRGREVIRSDSFYDMAGYNLGYWRIALLDTGMPITATGTITHTLFDSLIRGFDCVNASDSLCTVAANGRVLNPRDDCWNHGISSASILTATSSLGNSYRGVTRFMVDGYKVYDQNGTGPGCGNGYGLNTAAAQRGFQAATLSGADVIVAEMQALKGSVLTTAADNAYNAGIAVIAAAGNFGLDPNTGAPIANSVRSPGEAHKAIAVGAVDAFSLLQENYQGRGPESDGRIKPEIQGPTNTHAASNQGYTAVGSFGGTSGSTPYIGGAATLLGWWMDSADYWNYPPGAIYTNLILQGNNFTNPTTNNTTGSGLLRMPAGGFPGGWGFSSLQRSQQVEIPITISGPSKYDLTAALWWPESAAQAHNVIDLYLYDPAGALRAFSVGGLSVFQKTRVAGLLTPGTWKLRISRRAVGTTTSQQIFNGFYYKESSQWPD